MQDDNNRALGTEECRTEKEYAKQLEINGLRSMRADISVAIIISASHLISEEVCMLIWRLWAAGASTDDGLDGFVDNDLIVDTCLYIKEQRLLS